MRSSLTGSPSPPSYTRATVEKVNTLGLVYTVEGTDPSLKPTLLAAHQDVVPVADASTWTYPPFEAVYDGEWLWGRGASDDKNSLTSLLSAVDTLLANPDWSPRRTIVVAFGFDEECSGFRGAGTIGPHLLERYGEDGIAVILDEGGLGTQSPDPSTLYALPAVMEKGHVDIWFDLSVAGGHSSVPFPHTGIGIVAEMIAALESNPYSPSIPDGGPVHNGLQCQARYSPSADPNVTRLVNSHDLDALAALLAAQDRPSQFSIQTSQSVDMIAGGQKINAMPESIMLGVNYRVAPQDSIPLVQHNVVKHIGAVVEKYGIQLRAFEGDDEYEAYVASSSSSLPTRDDVVRPEYDVDYNGVLVLEAKEKSAVTPASPTSGPVWDTFSGTIQHTFASEGTTVVPVGGIMTGNTDTRHYLSESTPTPLWGPHIGNKICRASLNAESAVVTELTPNVYRWSPNLHGGSEGVHTVDERVRMDAHMGMVKFYYNFVRAFDQADL